MSTGFAPYDSADYLTGAEGVREYLITYLEDGTADEIATAFQTIARAAGFSAFANSVGHAPAALMSAFADPHRMDVPLMLEIIRALGGELTPSAARAA